MTTRKYDDSQNLDIQGRAEYFHFEVGRFFCFRQSSSIFVKLQMKKEKGFSLVLVLNLAMLSIKEMSTILVAKQDNNKLPNYRSVVSKPHTKTHFHIHLNDRNCTYGCIQRK